MTTTSFGSKMKYNKLALPVSLAEGFCSIKSVPASTSIASSSPVASWETGVGIGRVALDEEVLVRAPFHEEERAVADEVAGAGPGAFAGVAEFGDDGRGQEPSFKRHLP